nr:sulfurtransferase [Cellulomonas sp. URHE0023]
MLVSAEALQAELAGPRRPVLLDVRWALGQTDGHARYLAGHLPDAVYVDLETELADPPTGRDGRHPLPSDLQASARRWGITRGRPVVAYDAVGGMSAARAWWLLRWAGVRDVRLLDGGLGAWTGPLEAGEVTPSPSDIVLSVGEMKTIDADAAARWSGSLLDARAAERFRGEVEPVDPRAGHIPGALSFPTAWLLEADGTFLSAESLRARFAALPGPVAVYCGSGVTAAHEVAALATIGIDAALYPGSWSQWSNDPSRPVATGE